MKKKRFSVEQMTAVLQQVAGGVPVGDVCRQVGISEQTFYRWKKIYGNMPPTGLGKFGNLAPAKGSSARGRLKQATQSRPSS